MKQKEKDCNLQFRDSDKAELEKQEVKKVE